MSSATRAPPSTATPLASSHTHAPFAFGRVACSRASPRRACARAELVPSLCRACAELVPSLCPCLPSPSARAPAVCAWQFYKLIENMDTAMLGKIRATLPGMVEHPPNSSSLLVFDDGKQQLWRLVPGGRALVRKPVLEGARGALATSGTQMTG